MKIKAKKLRKSSLFKLIFFSQIVPLAIFMLFCGILAFTGADTVKVNDTPVTGVGGFIAALIMYPVFLLLFSSFIWMGSAFGLWTFSWFRNIQLEFVEGEIIEENMQNQELEPTSLDAD
jgi:hypothetical protein